MSQSDDSPSAAETDPLRDGDWGETAGGMASALDGAEAGLQAELSQWKDTALRARADLDNFRKRMSQESADARRYANAALLEELLPVLDNFQFGLQAAESDAGAKNLLVGLNMVANQLQAFLRDQGVEEVAAVGCRFDPNLHEAVGEDASDTVPEGTVISQVRRGFKLRERLLRPATVIVSTGRANQA